MISFFGASVTQQKDGYAKQFSKLVNHNVKIFGYGGMNLDDVGIIYIDKVLDSNPEYCFIDFFSTYYRETDENTIEYIDTIIFKLEKINCIPIFLFFPRKDDFKREDFYKFVKEYLERYNILYLDLKKRFKEKDLDIYLRDIVHTTEKGTIEYAKIILDFFSKIKDWKSDMKTISVKKTKYCDIKRLKINKIFYDYFILDGNSEIIGVEAIVGLHSGLIEIDSDHYPKFEINTWDQWSYYNRPQFVLKHVTIKGKTIFKILNRNFDTSECKYEIKLKNNKKLIIKSIYYVGKDLRLVQVGKRSEINDFYLKVENKISSFKKKYLYKERKK